MTQDLTGKTVAFLVAPEGIEQAEPSLQTDLRNAGAEWVDEQVVVDRSGASTLITSRNPDDLKAFDAALGEELARS